jgi:hypothetical protein
VNTLKYLVVAVGAGTLALAGLQPAQAQSTDAYHSIQVFPVVVDSAAFAQRFTFRNPDTDTAVNVVPSYYPGTATSQVGPLNCPQFSIPAGSQKVFQSLREVCPDLAAGSQFGYLYTYENNAGTQPFAAFSRVSNPAGQGFSVEAFPAHTFTSADTVISGLRRRAATSSSPAFQTNCFIGNLQDVTAPAEPETTNVLLTLASADGTTIGSGSVDLATGHLTRLLDIFSVLGAPAGDHENARLTVIENGVFDEPGLMSFCTVQDNTSFGADFRVGKQSKGSSTAYSSWAAQDDHVTRHSTANADMLVPGDVAPRAFVIAPGLNSNTHVYYFRHPDWIECEITDAVTHARIPDTYGLEFRMIGPDGSTVIGGGNGQTGFGEIYLGDKSDLNNGANGRYTIEVESDTSSPDPRPYGLHCHSGSGATLGDMIRTGDVDRF